MPEFRFKNATTIPKGKFANIQPVKTEEKKFSFCFEFCSMKGGHICFNNKGYDPDDVIKLIEFLKEISQYTIADIFGEHKDKLHFHEVDLRHHAYLSEIYKTTLKKCTLSQLPTLFQLQVFTDNRRFIAPRITFYIQTDGVFKLVYYDYHHLLCSTTYGKDKSIPDTWFEHYVE